MKNIKLRVEHIDEINLKLLFRGANSSILNMFRRKIMSDVPTISIEYITIHENTSNINDEFLCHRLCMIPIKIIDTQILDQKDFKVKFTLNFYCTTKTSHVLAKHLKTNEKNVRLLYDDIIITSISEGQKISITAVACIGTGKEHSKWCPVSSVHFIQKEKKSDYIFNIESIGTLRPEYIFIKSLKMMSKISSEIEFDDMNKLQNF